MNEARGWSKGLCVAAACTSLAAALAAGCGMPGTPQPPSLNLPQKVTDLAAARNGDVVTLTWTMPRRTTDRLLLKGTLEARICRFEAAGACVAAGSVQGDPGAAATFRETLAAELASGGARTLSYQVELVNKKGRSAGLSNAARVAAGEVPGAIVGLTAEMRRKGVLLSWQGDGSENRTTRIRLVRRLLTPPAPKQKREAGEHEPGLLAAPKEPVERTLLVDAGMSLRAIDEDVRFDEKYEYRAQRVATVEADRRTLELDGPLSAPVEIDTKNTFPPAVPTGLAAVGTAGENGSGPSIDLNWLPDTEPDLAGYVVYRREGDGEWERISPLQPVVGPGFHDANVTAGHKYTYAVSAVDEEGHESARSATAEETAPAR